MVPPIQETLACTSEATFDSPCRTAQNFRALILRQTLNGAKNEGEAESLRQGSKTPLEFAHVALPLEGEVWRQTWAGLGCGQSGVKVNGGTLIPDGPALGMISTKIQRNPEEPCLEPASALVTRQSHPGPDKSVLA